MFHSGKMTTGTGLQDLGFMIDYHNRNQHADKSKFNAIKSVARSNSKLKKVKIWLTLMTLNREIGDPFDLFDVCQGHILMMSNGYAMKGLICEADVLQFYGEANDRKGFFELDHLGHQQGCISITEDLENFYIALMQKSKRKEFNSLLKNDLNMFHFEKLLNLQLYCQKIWLRRKIDSLNECKGKTTFI